MTQPSFLPGVERPDSPRTDVSPVAREKARLDINAKRVLERLKLGPATNVQLCTKECGGLNAVRSRIPQLRKQGWVIKATLVHQGTYLYTLHGLRGCERTSA